MPEASTCALAAAGLIGAAVAVVHGVLLQRLFVAPLASCLAQTCGVPRSSRVLVPALLQFSTFNWLVCGIALVVSAMWLSDGARALAGTLAATSYAYGAVGNMVATRGRHPGGYLYAAAVALIFFGLSV